MFNKAINSIVDVANKGIARVYDAFAFAPITRKRKGGGNKKGKKGKRGTRKNKRGTRKNKK